MEAVPRLPKDAEEKATIERKIPEVWATASHLHFNQNFQFNSQATAVQFTPRLTLGGRAWIAVKLNDERLEQVAALWGNCTLGLLIHWYWANKQQSGRGNIGKNQLASLPVLDVSGLTDDQINAGVAVFDALKSNEMQPLHELHTDGARHELDRRFLTECLGFAINQVAPGGPIDLVRQKLAAEPSIRGHK